MNHYGLLAQRHWMTYAPAAYREVENPEQFFTQLGEEIAAQVTQTARALQSSTAAQTQYMDRVGQLTAMKRQAEELVLQELVYEAVQVEPSTDPVARLRESLSALPTSSTIEDLIDQMRQEWADRAEMDALTSTAGTQTEQNEMAFWEQLKVWVDVDPETLSDPELEALIWRLEPLAQRAEMGLPLV